MFWVLLVGTAAPAIDSEDRSYMDPLPPMLKLLWPFILLLSNTLVQLYSNRYLDNTEEKLQKTGVGYLMTAEQFVALRYLSAIITFGMALLMVAALQPKESTLILLLAPLGGFLFPLVWLSDVRKRRTKAVIKALPVYLDFITMAIEAGLNLSGALQQAMQKGPAGPLRNEFAIVMRDLRSGSTRAEAFKRMADRLDIAEITSFVNALVQAERMGGSMATTMRIQSEQRRSERFQRAEKQAMQAPVKLIFPLIVFIFPVTFIILGFPIAMKFLNN
ncbi:secretion system protein F [Sedimenticola thiotaurini]|uniref:Secretion system protein F n=1 Tax=Sedimenticola thiotaurini TaxID=1543721 RepID=A0A0F7K5G5_9GAMM|nr:secretion system protein F [Sedimenticola thiotaurini]